MRFTIREPMKNRNLLSYILGLATGFIFIPLIEELINVAFSWIEVLKTKPSGIINEWNKKMATEDQESVESDACAIGFQYTPNEDEYYEDDFEEE